MAHRAPPSGICLTADDAALVKGMLARGNRRHDIAAWFGFNGGRIGEIAAGVKFGRVDAAPTQLLPPVGLYLLGRAAAVLIQAISKARNAPDTAEDFVRRQLQHRTEGMGRGLRVVDSKLPHCSTPGG